MRLQEKAASYFRRFREFPIFFRQTLDHWAEAMMSGGASGIVIFLVTSLLSLSRYWLLCVFVIAFFVGAYFAWRDEYTPHDLAADVDGSIDVRSEASVSREDDGVRRTLVISLMISIRNAGETPTIAYDWKLGIPMLLPKARFEP